MAKRKAKPTVKEIIELYEDAKKRYDESGIYASWLADEQMYELDFKEELNLPQEFDIEGIVLPTARDLVDACVDNIDILNPRVWVNRKGESIKSNEEQNLLRKFGLGVLYRNNIESSISPIRVGAKHYWMYGVAIFKTVWDADRYIDKPEKVEGESDEVYAIRVDEWRSERHDSIPIVIQSVNPRNIILDPYYDGGLFVFEVRDELCLDTQTKYPKWGNPKLKKSSEKVEHISFWTKEHRCELYDKEPVLKGEVVKHDYGFIPYIAVDSGLGNVSSDNDLKKRYVGVLRYVKDILISESRDYSIGDVILKRTAWPWGTITGPNAQIVTSISQKFGEYTPLPDGVELQDISPKIPPDALLTWMGVSANYLANHAAPPSVRGLGEEGVRSGADRRLVIAQAAVRYKYANEAFKNGIAKVLSNCARIMKNVIPGDISVWARTPTDEFDIEIKKDKMKEPFTFYVEFAPISEEDEYRRHDDLERLYKSGLVTKNWARKQMSNVDSEAMELDEEKEKFKNDSMVQQVLSQYFAAQVTEALQQREVAEGESPVPAQTQGVPMQGQPSQGPGRRMVAPIPNNAPIGSPEAMQNQLERLRSQTPVNPFQGQGGGGNRP